MAYPKFEQLIRKAYRKRGTMPKAGMAFGYNECALAALSGVRIRGMSELLWGQRNNIPDGWSFGFMHGWDNVGFHAANGRGYSAGYRIGCAMAKQIMGANQ